MTSLKYSSVRFVPLAAILLLMAVFVGRAFFIYDDAQPSTSAAPAADSTSSPPAGTDPSPMACVSTTMSQTQPSAYPTVQLETSEGTIVVELWPDVAPGHAQNFLKLTSTGFYDGLTFHRILPGFVIQGGCPKGDGTGGPAWKVKAEFNDRKHEKGVLSMARSAHPDSAGSQFFVCLGREHCQHLDKQYTAFGKVISGIEAVDKIAATPLANRGAGTPANPPKILKATVLTQ